jgi:hypothetical protein
MAIMIMELLFVHPATTAVIHAHQHQAIVHSAIAITIEYYNSMANVPAHQLPTIMALMLSANHAILDVSPAHLTPNV